MKEDGGDPVDLDDVDVTPSKLKRQEYERELARLQLELVKLQHLGQARRPAGRPGLRGP